MTALPPDPYTMSLRMCDDHGLVSHERGVLSNSNLTFLDLHNNMRLSNANGGCTLITEPFACTGSAHMAGEHIFCTSPAHSHGEMGRGTVITARGTVE